MQTLLELFYFKTKRKLILIHISCEKNIPASGSKISMARERNQFRFKLCDGTETNLRLTISTNLQLLALISIESIILIYNSPPAAVSPEGCDLQVILKVEGCIRKIQILQSKKKVFYGQFINIEYIRLCVTSSSNIFYSCECNPNIKPS